MRAGKVIAVFAALAVAALAAWIGGSILAVLLAQPLEDARPGVAEACLYAFAGAVGVATFRFVFRALRRDGREAG